MLERENKENEGHTVRKGYEGEGGHTVRKGEEGEGRAHC